ncbi:hypothetical protein GCM10009612_65920 [Streptomyces beijiangensis]
MPRCRQPLRHPLPASSGASNPLCDFKESITMAETTVRRVRHASRTSESDRKNAAAALQRALDRRDNGGATGH